MEWKIQKQSPVKQGNVYKILEFLNQSNIWFKPNPDY